MATATYYDRYDELRSKYKIARSMYKVYSPANVNDFEPEMAQKIRDVRLKVWDVVVECIGTGYAHKKYRIVKNGPGLSTEDLAIICDQGNLCFGYRTEGNIICIHTD